MKFRHFVSSTRIVLLYVFVLVVCGIIHLHVNAYLSELLLVAFVGAERYRMGMSRGYRIGYDAAHAMYKRASTRRKVGVQGGN